MANLLPCPFCGGEAAFGTVRYGDATVKEQRWEQDTFHLVNCVLCGADNQGVIGHRTQDAAAERWNRRAANRDALFDEMVEALEIARPHVVYTASVNQFCRRQLERIDAVIAAVRGQK